MAGVSNQTVEHDAKTRGIILHIVEQIKSKGVFDRFRRDCLEELDSKEPYRQLKQRVESHVATFLSKQMFSANLPKNQLRTSLRANINQSEVLSKGVDRLLEQVLVEKSIPFYKEIENLVEEHLISTGHYTRYDRDKPQRSAERDGQPRSEHAKLSDKEVEDIIKEETNKFLEASADGGKSEESDKNLHADSPPPGTSGEVIEVETLISGNDDNSTDSSTVLNTNVDAIEKSETADLSSMNAEEKLNVGIETSGEEAGLKVKTENSAQARDFEVLGAQVASESQLDLADATSSQEIDAQMHEPGNSAIACNPNLDDQISNPEIIRESNPVKPSAIPSLQSESEAIGVEVGLFSFEENTSEEGKLNEDLGIVPEVEGSEGYKPSVEYTQAAASTLVEGANIKEQNASELELHVLESEVKLGESKAEVEKLDTQIEATDSPEITKASIIHKSQVDNQEMYTPDESKSRIDKPDVLEPKVGQLDVVIPEVSKPKVDKRPKPEEKAEQTAAENKLASKESLKQATKETISIPNVFSTDEETDEDLGITEDRVIPRSKTEPESKPELAALDIAEWSDSDITVSSVHTSDLSSLEDSMSDMEYEDYQELALKKSKQMKTGESSAGTSKDIDSEENNCDESSADTRKKIDSKDESGEEAGESSAGTRQKVEKSQEKFGKSRVKEIDGMEENEEGKYEESGADGSEDRKCDSKEDNNDVSPGDSTDSGHLQESRLFQSHVTAPKRLETSDNALPDPILVDNQTSQNCSQESAPPSIQSSEPVTAINIEKVAPEVEPISSYDSEQAQATEEYSDANADNEIALGDTVIGSHKLGKRKHLRRISTEQESESSNDIQTPREEQREPHPQRRSARVASKDKSRSDEKDDSSQGNIKELEKGEEAGDSSRRLRRRHSSQEKGGDLRRSTSKEERRNERAEKRAARLASDSNDSDVKASKRSKRQVRPTRCYSPSENS